MEKAVIAEIAHNVERSLRLVLNEPVKYTWKDETEDKKMDAFSVIEIVEKNIDANPGKVQELIHEHALATLNSRGYVFGQKDDNNIKTSSSMVRYADLPLDQKAKIAVVYQTIVSLLRLA